MKTRQVLTIRINGLNYAAPKVDLANDHEGAARHYPARTLFECSVAGPHKIILHHPRGGEFFVSPSNLLEFEFTV